MKNIKKWWALIRISASTLWTSMLILFNPNRKLPLKDSIKLMVHFNVAVLKLAWVIGTSDEFLQNLGG